MADQKNVEQLSTKKPRNLKRHKRKQIPEWIKSDPNRLLRMEEVCALTGAESSTVYDWVSEGILPRPVKPTPKSARWVYSEIMQAIEALREKREVA